MLDEHGNPILHDVREQKTREGVIGAPLGTWLTNGKTGRRFVVKADFPLDPDYIQERDRLTRLIAQVEKARAAKQS